MKPERIATVKLPAFREGWRSVHGEEPTANECVIGLSVALHETSAGDAWKGPDGILGTQDDEHNWGATTLRTLRAHEQFLIGAAALARIIDAGLPARGTRLWFNRFRYSWQTYENGSGEPDVAAMQRDLGFKGAAIDGKVGPKTMAALEDQYPGTDPSLYWPKIKLVTPLNSGELEAVRPIHPTVAKGHPARAAEAMRVLSEGFAPEDLPPAVIHCDSTPKDGAYFVWFAAFPTDADGAEYFIRFLRYSGELAAMKSGNPFDMAAAMYDAHYFTGFNDPDEPGGDERNIADYAAGISKHMASVRAAIAMADAQ